MPLPSGLQVYITSADGTKRRRLPRAQIESVSTTIDRFGGYGQGSVSTAIPYNQAGSLTVLQGDRVETWFGGKRRYRGYVSALQPSADEPRKVVIQCYGAAAILRKQFCNKAYAFPSGGVDVAEAFAALAHDFLLKATGPGGFKLIQSTQILPLGTTLQSLDARRKLAGDVLDALLKEAGNLAVWGVDVDAAGNNRLYLRPLSPASPPTHALAVPGQNVETATGELQTADIINQLTITGGAATYPNLLHNGGFELPVQQADGAGNLVVNGGFENASDDHTVAAWALSAGAQSFTTFSFPPKQATPYSGSRCLGLESTTQTAVQVTTAPLTAGHNYILSVRAAKEIDQQVCTGHALLQVYSGANGAGTLLLAQTVALTPSGQGYDYFSGTFAAPAGCASFRATLACDTNDSSHVPANNGYSGGLLIDDVQLYDLSVVYQDGWYVDAVDQTNCRVNAVNWVQEGGAFEGAYCVYLDAAAEDSDGHDLKLQPLQGSRYKVASTQALRFGAWVKSPPASLNPNPPKFFLEMNFYDSSGHITRTPPRATFTPGFLAQWTYFELAAYALDGEVAGDANLTWRSAGSLLVDALSVRDAQAPAMAAANGSAAALAPYLPDGPLVYFVAASDPYLNSVWRPANGFAGPAPYAASEAVYGPRCGVFSDSSVLLLDDAMAVANGTFLSQGALVSRPSVTLVNDARLFWPGETLNLIGADGAQLSPAALPIARVVDSWDGLLKTRIESETEQPDVSLAIKRIVQAEINRLGPGQSAGASGGGYSGAAGGGASTTPVYRSSLQASPADATLHDAFTGAPHAAQASQDGWTATSAEVVAARTRTAKGVSSVTLEGRLDAMETDLAGVSSFAAAPPLVPTGISQVASYSGATLYIQAVPAFYSGMDPAPSVPYVFWQKSTDGGSTWTGYDNTSATTFPGPVLQASLAPPASGAAAPTIRFRVRTENASGTASAWYAQTADTAYAAPPSAAGSVTSVAGRVGDVTLSAADVSGLGTAAQANLPAAGSNASPVQVVRGDDTRLGGSITVAESLGSGADMALTTAYATVPNISLAVPASQAVSASALVELTADSGSGSSYDDLYVQLYDTALGAAIAGSERHISTVPAGKRGLVTLEKFVGGASAGRTLVLQAKNGTAARGSVSGAKSLLQTLALTSGTTTGTGTGSASGPGGVSAGLLLWLKADAIPAQVNGTAIPAWLDSSGNGYNATAAGTAQPTYLVSGLNGLPALTFNGTSNAMDSPCPSATGPLTVFAVVQPVSSSGNQAILGTPLAGGFEWRLQGAAPQVPAILAEGQTQGPVASAGVSSTAASLIAFTLGSASSGSAPYAFYAGAAAAGSGTTSLSLSVSTVALGKYANGGVVGELFRGLMAEIIQFNRVLTSAEMSAVTSYLRSKWSV